MEILSRNMADHDFLPSFRPPQNSLLLMLRSSSPMTNSRSPSVTPTLTPTRKRPNIDILVFFLLRRLTRRPYIYVFSLGSFWHTNKSDKILALTTAAGVELEPIWASLLAKALEGKNIKDLLSNVGGGGAPAAGGGAAPAASGGAAAAEVPKEEEKKEEAKDESDDDMVRPFFSSFSGNRSNTDDVCRVLVFSIDRTLTTTLCCYFLASRSYYTPGIWCIRISVFFFYCSQLESTFSNRHFESCSPPETIQEPDCGI